MKTKTIMFLIAVGLLMSGCNTTNNDSNISSIDSYDNQEQLEKFIISAELDTFPFSEAVELADLIAEVQIIEKVEERDEPYKTIFKAKIVDTIKKDTILEVDTILVMQQGNSNAIFNGNELFQPKDTFILFLKNAIGNGEVDNTYWILGEETGMFKEIDQNTVVKLSLKDVELENVEIKTKSNMITEQQIEKGKRPRDIQVLMKEEFKNMIKKSLGE